jgi:hypothetical protein
MKEKNKRVSEKIRVLRHEGEPEDKAVATALSMERSGRLKRGGKYVHKRKSRKGRRR